MIDLDEIERLAREAERSLSLESYACRQFARIANPATILALVARLRAAEAVVGELRPMVSDERATGDGVWISRATPFAEVLADALAAYRALTEEPAP